VEARARETLYRRGDNALLLLLPRICRGWGILPATVNHAERTAVNECSFIYAKVQVLSIPLI
jgi:hypothetical protein